MQVIGFKPVLYQSFLLCLIPMLNDTKMEQEIPKKGQNILDSILILAHYWDNCLREN